MNNSLTSAAKDSIAMSKQTGDRNFHIMGFAIMAISGVAAVLHAVHGIYRDLKPANRKTHDKHERPKPPAATGQEEEPQRHDQPRQSWVHKARVAERPEGPPKAWTEHAGRHSRARHH